MGAGLISNLTVRPGPGGVPFITVMNAAEIEQGHYLLQNKVTSR